MTLLVLFTFLAVASSTQKQLEAADRACLARLELGEIEGARERCGTLEPATHPISAYWRALLETDSTKLRQAMDPERLARLDPPGKRLLLLAGRYQFATGNRTRLEAVEKLLGAKYPKSAELDTLRNLAKTK
jgi:hypothetical protein